MSLKESDSGIIYDIWLSLRSDVGNVRAKLLVDYFGSAQEVYRKSRSELLEIQGIGKLVVSDLLNKDLTGAEKILTQCKQEGCFVLSISDSRYPYRLRNIYDPPTVLFIKGSLKGIDTMPVIGIVGTRNCTPYGYKQAEKLGRELSQNGIAVTTGLARGIDTAAALGGLDGSAPVFGVIGCGIDIVYPVQNQKLFSIVEMNGAIISEYPPGTEVRPEYFPQRNRIISGLSCGVAVIEAPQRSGALITAHFALEQNREIFVLPGNVDLKTCIGSNKLLRTGAIPFMSAEDIIDEYKDLYPGLQKPIDNIPPLDYIDVDKLAANLSATEKTILGSIGSKALYTDEIITATGINAQTVLSALTGLELEGIIKRNNASKYTLK